MVARVNLSSHHQPESRWARLAVVARERASEQSDKAATASSTETKGPHLEQQVYLMRLAEVYEERARAGALA